MATLGELILRYGGEPEVALRNLPRSAKENWRKAVEFAKGLPAAGRWAGDAALGGLQYVREMSPAAQRKRPRPPVVPITPPARAWR